MSDPYPEAQPQNLDGNAPGPSTFGSADKPDDRAKAAKDRAAELRRLAFMGNGHTQDGSIVGGVVTCW